jgi:hypothetical protein
MKSVFTDFTGSLEGRGMHGVRARHARRESLKIESGKIGKQDCE